MENTEHRKPDGAGSLEEYIQPAGSYRFAADALLLRDRCVDELSAGMPAVLLDIGAGCGVIGLEVLARLPHICCVAVEREPELAEAAAANAERFGFEGRFTVICADIRESGTAKLVRDEGLKFAGRHGIACKDAGRPFAAAVCNPPWRLSGTGFEPVSGLRRNALFGGPDVLPSFFSFAGKCLDRGGLLMTVGGVDRLTDYLRAAPEGAVRIRPFYPDMHGDAALFLMTVKRGAKAAFRIEEPIWAAVAQGMMKKQGF